MTNSVQKRQKIQYFVALRNYIMIAFIKYSFESKISVEMPTFKRTLNYLMGMPGTFTRNLQTKWRRLVLLIET